MVYIICLDAKENLVTKEQVFTCTLKKIMRETFCKINKINIITPINCEIAKFNEFVPHTFKLEDEFVIDFIEDYGLALCFAILSKEENKNLLDLKALQTEYLCDILLKAYALDTVPDEIPIYEIEKYCDILEADISANIKKYYNHIVNKIK